MKNKEGYPDPTAGKALASIRHREKQEKKKIRSRIRVTEAKPENKKAGGEEDGN